MILEISKLTKYFGGLAAVKNFDLRIKDNEMVGMIGPNGAGKTTVFNLLTGFLIPTSGSILFKDGSITGLKPHEICKKGIVRTFQVVKPLARMTVLENVMAGAFCRLNRIKDAKDKALEVLEFTGLIAKQNILASGLTIADRKRLELSRVLATDPSVILLDETAAGLNPKETEAVIGLIGKLKQRGISTVVGVEHVMKFIMAISDRIIVLHHGEKIADGTPEEIGKDKHVIKAYLGETYA
jgi:branched-chain amino acid transport system ATP-binding protein